MTISHPSLSSNQTHSKRLRGTEVQYSVSSVNMPHILIVFAFCMLSTYIILLQ
jgi:hypothetical protein